VTALGRHSLAPPPEARAEVPRPRASLNASARYRILAVVVGVVAFLSTSPAPAVARSPVHVNQLLTDRVGALGTEADEVQQALEAVRRETDGTLYVVLVSGFGAGTGADWVEQVTTQSDIGPSHVLLAIDVAGPTYEWRLGDAAPWDVTEVEELITTAAEPEILEGHWAAAITAVAEGLRDGDLPAVAGHDEGGAAESSTATTTAVIGTIALVALAGYQFSRRTTARDRQTSET
jgi:hypothetical protein